MKRLMTAALSPSRRSRRGTAAAQTPPATPASPAKKELVAEAACACSSAASSRLRARPRRAAGGADDAGGRPGAAAAGARPKSARRSAKEIEAEVKKYVDEAMPLVRERAVKLAPSTIGPILEEKFSEDELKQLVAWLESPTEQEVPVARPRAAATASCQKLVADAPPVARPEAAGARRQDPQRCSACRPPGAPHAVRRRRRRRPMPPPRRASDEAGEPAWLHAARRTPPDPPDLSSRCARASTRSTASCSAC